MKKYLKPTLLILITAFASLTLFLTTSIIFDVFGIREAEGNFVWGIIWINFIAAWLYFASVYGIHKKKSWASNPLLIATLLLLIAIGYLAFHVFFGGAFELKTFPALAFRGSVTIVFYVLTNRLISIESKKAESIAM